MLIPYLKKIALFGIISILFTGHVNSKPLTNSNDNYAGYIDALCPNGEIPVLRDINNPNSFVTCVSKKMLDYFYSNKLQELPKDQYSIVAISKEDYYELLKYHFKKDRIKSQIIKCVVIGFIIIIIMSLPINILWRFRLKISAFLFAILTVLSVIAIPFMFSW